MSFKPPVTVQVSVTGTRWLRADRNFAAGDIVAFENPRFYVDLQTWTTPRGASETPLGATEWALYELAHQALLSGWTKYDQYATTVGSERYSTIDVAKRWPELKGSDARRFRHLYGVMSTNRLPCYLENTCVGIGFYDTFAYINHSCLTANCFPSAGKDGRGMRIIARTAIKAGDEITIPYSNFSVDTPTFERRAHLLSAFGFECTCYACCNDTECAFCGRSLRRKIRKCNYCYQTSYCSTECQEFDWENGTHRSSCSVFNKKSRA